MNTRTYCFALLCLVGASFIVLALGVRIDSVQMHSETTDSGSESQIKSAENTILSATKARIKAESDGSLLSAQVAIALVSPEVSVTDEGSGQERRGVPTAPNGYSFVTHHGEMTKGRMKDRIEISVPDANRPSWFDWTTSISEIARQASKAGRDWSFGWIRVDDSAEISDVTESFDGTAIDIVGYSGRLLKARLPASIDQLRAIRDLSFVDGIGVIPTEAKLQRFSKESLNSFVDVMPVFVTLMTTDHNGSWGREMAALGAVVGGYDPDLRVYTVNASRMVVNALATADFVQAIEPIIVVKATHDTAIPAMGIDALRQYDNEPGLFSDISGSSVPIGVMDTGLNINHLDIATHRKSICAATFDYFGSEGALFEEDDLWIDKSGHGTHVTGTVVGNGLVSTYFAGVAPGVQHIRFAKVLNSSGFGSSYGIMLGMDYLAIQSGCEQDSASNQAKPLVVNMSLAASSLSFEGRDVGARKLDSTVWNHKQLYVVAQSNEGRGGYSNYAAAKNSLAVGAASDEGVLAGFSSHGPTIDGRLSPNVVGTGVQINSTKGNGSRARYVSYSGTSMASPMVAGVATLLMDAIPSFKEQPALVRARLMASAIRPDAWLDDESGFPLNNTSGPGRIQTKYGLGKVSARTAVLQRDQVNGWFSGSSTANLREGDYAYYDIEVPDDTSRLDVVMTWDEPAADTIASTVMNDLDLWIDRDADCESEFCGEYVSQSRIDNVEWLVVKNPEPGLYRLKVLAHRVYSDAVRSAVAWTVIQGSSTPSLVVEADKHMLEPNREHELNLTLSTDSYVAAGTKVHIDCRSLGDRPCTDIVSIVSAKMTREDGVSVDLKSHSNSTTISLGDSIQVGELDYSEQRILTFRIDTRELNDDVNAWLRFTASAWNGRAESVTVELGPGSSGEVNRPENDDFDSPSELQGNEGSVELDLIYATTEPGEPTFLENQSRPVGSVWYSWTAKAGGPVRFEVPARGSQDWEHHDIWRSDSVDVYQGERVTDLQSQASGEWGVQWFAQKGSTYLIRVASSERSAAMTLRWTNKVRPLNDNFADAQELTGEKGSVNGSTSGATLETGESFGELSSTTWYRWVAPKDSSVIFERSPYGVILVFEGGNLSTLRLVSNLVWHGTRFSAKAGIEYRIAIAEQGHGTGADYSLEWYLGDIKNYEENDLFANAIAIEPALSGNTLIDVNLSSSVEPQEPIETGVLTKWWSWEAPEDGLFTWMVEDSGEESPSHMEIRVSMFKGSSLESLELLGITGPGAPFGFIVDVIKGEKYSIAVGLPNGHPQSFQSSKWYPEKGILSWGPTPINDDLLAAIAINGISGSIVDSNTFATESSNEKRDFMGRKTVWWEYEGMKSGFIRFVVEGEGGPWVITAHQYDTESHERTATIGSSLWQQSENAMIFRADKGNKYFIALGVNRGGRGSDFTLSWEETLNPEWLRFAGQVGDGDLDSSGNRIYIRGPGELIVNSEGTAVYLASATGLHVFRRDENTGLITHIQQIESEFELEFATMIWDSNANRILANDRHDCTEWYSFSQLNDGPELAEGQPISSTEEPGFCDFKRMSLLMDKKSENLYQIRGWEIDHFQFDGERDLRFVSRFGEYNRGIHSAVLSNDETRLYILRDDMIAVYERDTSTGESLETTFDKAVHSFLATYGSPLGISTDDSYLFFIKSNSEYSSELNIYSVKDPNRPTPFGRLKPNDKLYDYEGCKYFKVQEDDIAVDVFCTGIVFSAEWNNQTEELKMTDLIESSEVDKFNKLVPHFSKPRGFATSPDGEHFYISSDDNTIVTIGRDWPTLGDY